MFACIPYTVISTHFVSFFFLHVCRALSYISVHLISSDLLLGVESKGMSYGNYSTTGNMSYSLIVRLKDPRRIDVFSLQRHWTWLSLYKDTHFTYALLTQSLVTTALVTEKLPVETLATESPINETLPG